MTFEELIKKTAELLHKDGLASFIIPYDQMGSFSEIAIQNALKLSRVVYIKGNSTTVTKRVLLEFSFHEKEVEEQELIIEVDRHQYTEDYIKLTKDFYLKM